MRILVLAMADSVHTARWLSQITDPKMQILLFPIEPCVPHPELKSWSKFLSPFQLVQVSKRSISTLVPSFVFNYLLNAFLKRYVSKRWLSLWLKLTIKVYKPDIIHSLEFQHAGYLCLDIRENWKGKFPTWIATNWGSDISLFGRLKAHKPAIQKILEHADYYSAECERDYQLAKQMGMKAKPLPCVPNAGGLHIDQMKKLRTVTPTKDRQIIVVKGYQSTFGRALVALEALTKIQKHLQKFDIHIYSAERPVEVAAELAAQDYGLNIKMYPAGLHVLTHREMIELHSQARVYIGLSISDGISTSLLESMALGSFPIQTCTSCADEWIEHGKSGFIVKADDSEALSQFILKALQDDEMVTKAAEINWQTIQARASFEHTSQIAESFYKTAFKN